MENIWNTGIATTLLAQSAGKWLEPPMHYASLLGTEGFYLVFLVLFYWCIDASAGIRLGLMLMLSDSVNTFFKLLFHHPRPYWYSADVRPYSIENSFGLPSGHAQHAVSMWGTIAVLYPGRRLRLAAAMVILLISFSRVYLGVHFYTDVLLGWVLGLALLFSVARFFTPVTERLKRLNLSAQIVLAAFISGAVFAIQVIPLLINSGWVFPEVWMNNINSAVPGTETPDPRRISGIVSVSGAAFGYGAGLALVYRSGGFSAEGTLKQKCARFAAGLVIGVLIYSGLKVILPHGDSTAAEFCRYIRYAFTGLWIAWGAPYLFIRLGLAGKKR